MKKTDKILETVEELGFKGMVNKMSFTDLHSLFIFVSGDFNKQFGGKLETRKLVHSRYNIVLDELNKRTYGGNPYKAETIRINGDKPEDIDLSKFEKKDECSCGGSNEECKFCNIDKGE